MGYDGRMSLKTVLKEKKYSNCDMKVAKTLENANTFFRLLLSLRE